MLLIQINSLTNREIISFWMKIKNCCYFQKCPQLTKKQEPRKNTVFNYKSPLLRGSLQMFLI